MKKKWETPRMYIEEFVPNEYVSSCLYLECAIPGQDLLKAMTIHSLDCLIFRLNHGAELPESARIIRNMVGVQ